MFISKITERNNIRLSTKVSIKLSIEAAEIQRKHLMKQSWKASMELILLQLIKTSECQQIE